MIYPMLNFSYNATFFLYLTTYFMILIWGDLFCFETIVYGQFLKQIWSLRNLFQGFRLWTTAILFIDALWCKRLSKLGQIGSSNSWLRIRRATALLQSMPFICQ